MKCKTCGQETPHEHGPREKPPVVIYERTIMVGAVRIRATLSTTDSWSFLTTDGESRPPLDVPLAGPITVAFTELVHRGEDGGRMAWYSWGLFLEAFLKVARQASVFAQGLAAAAGKPIPGPMDANGVMVDVTPPVEGEVPGETMLMTNQPLEAVVM